MNTLSTFVNSPDLCSVVCYQPISRTITLSSLREKRVRTLVGTILSSAQWSANSRYIALGFVGDVVLIYKPDGTLCSSSFGPPKANQTGSSVAEMAWSPDSHLLAVANSAGEIRVISPGSSHLLTLDRMHTSVIRSLSWSHNSTLLASASCDGQIIIWDARASRALSRWHCPLQVGELVWSTSHLLVKSHGLMIQAIPLRPERPSSRGVS